jgi:hypothetical protein
VIRFEGGQITVYILCAKSTIPPLESQSSSASSASVKLNLSHRLLGFQTEYFWLYAMEWKWQNNLFVGKVETCTDTREYPKSFRTCHLKREQKMVQLCAPRCSCITILWVTLVSFAAITLCAASQRGFVVVYFVMDSVRKLLDTPSYAFTTFKSYGSM